jgi:hypothetical protein
VERRTSDPHIEDAATASSLPKDLPLLVKSAEVAAPTQVLEGDVEDEIQKKLHAKKLKSDKQKETELQMLEAAKRKAEQQLELEERQQMKEGIIESAK